MLSFPRVIVSCLLIFSGLQSSQAISSELATGSGPANPSPALSKNAIKAPPNQERGGQNASWAGPYVGVSSAYNVSNLQFTLGDVIDLDGFGARGYGFGGLAGYNFMLNANEILSIEASGEYSDNRISIGLKDIVTGDHVDAHARTDWSGTIALRYGYLSSPNTMLFASVGATMTHALADYSLVIDGIEEESGREQDIFYGLAFGAVGIETRIGHGWNARVDYTENLLRANIYDLDGLSLMAKPNIGTGRVAIIYSFDDASVVKRPLFKANWEGGYFGGAFGIEHGVSRYDLPFDSDFEFYLNGLGSDGITARLISGYNFKVADRIVAGIEADIEKSSSRSRYGVNIDGEFTGLVGSDEWNYGFKARAGYLLSPETIGFVYAGVSRITSDLRLMDGGFTIPGAIEKYSRRTVDIGGGLETFISETTSVRIEYGVSQFEKVHLLDEVPEIGTLSKFGSNGSLALISHF